MCEKFYCDHDDLKQCTIDEVIKECDCNKVDYWFIFFCGVLFGIICMLRF